MPAGVFDSVAKFFTSTPGVLVAGGVWFYGVQKFFKEVEEKLTDDTKLEIAVWLLDRKKVSPVLQTWPETFAKIFDRVFGRKHLSLKCFGRSCVASFSVALLAWLLTGMLFQSFTWRRELELIVLIVVGNALPDYISLLETRWCLRMIARTHSGILWVILVMVDFVFTFAIAASAVVILSGPFLFVTVISNLFSFDLTTTITVLLDQLKLTSGLFLRMVQSPSESWGIVRSLTRGDPRYTVFFFPAFFTSVWLWLYAGSGFLLKAARRLDIGFDWFNRHFDIEKKPLQSIGLVAGAIVAVVYWTVVVVHHFVS
jgi:hypothetical protein